MSTPLPSQPGLRILLVDDHEDLLLMMRLIFRRKQEYAIETANSGQKAIEVASEFCPHLIISDITMPGMDGFEMMDEMKARDIAPLKAIALSGHEVPQRDHADSGYDIHLTKPIDFEELFLIIERMTQPDEN